MFYMGASEKDWVLIDSKEEFLDFKRIYPWPDKVFMWNTNFNNSQLLEMQVLRLEVSSNNTKELPIFVKYCNNLECLSIPFKFLKSLCNENLPSSLKILHLCGKGSIALSNHLHLPQIESLTVSGTLKFQDNFPNLRNLEVRLDPQGIILERISVCKNLVALNVWPCNNKNVLSKLGNLPLEDLRLNNGNLSSLTGIEQLTSLKRVWIQNLPNLVDLSPLKRIKNLEVLTIAYCKHLQNIQPLIEIPTLANLTIFACGNIGINKIEPILKQYSGQYKR